MELLAWILPSALLGGVVADFPEAESQTGGLEVGSLGRGAGAVLAAPWGTGV